jgi:hypothetical protein
MLSKYNEHIYLNILIEIFIDFSFKTLRIKFYFITKKKIY